MVTATTNAPAAKTAVARKAPPAMHTRMINQLTNAALRDKIKAEELDQLSSHITKLKSLLG